jgi:Protein of unknown function (DUF3445)
MNSVVPSAEYAIPYEFFPVEAPYRVKNDLIKHDPAKHGPILMFDAQQAYYRDEKRKAIAAGLAQSFSLCDANAAVKEIVKVLNSFGPAQLDPSIAAPNELALALQDDWVVMSDKAELLHVCFPSGWRPREKLGQTMAQIHAPVAQGDRLIAASDQLTRAMLSKGPFVRYVWTLSPTNALSRHPDLYLQKSPESPPVSNILAPTLNDIWFRFERQITVPLPESRRALFLIRVFVMPLREVLASPQKAALLKDSLISMPLDVVAYKGIAALRDAVLSISPL